VESGYQRPSRGDILGMWKDFQQKFAFLLDGVGEGSNY
jgi:hypothetical protein